MRNLLAAFCCFFFLLAGQAQAQKKTGVITYTSISETEMNLAGNAMKRKMTLTMKLMFIDKDYKIEATMENMSGLKFYRYYVNADTMAYNVNLIGADHYAVFSNKVKITGVTKTGNTKNILGYNCIEFTGFYEGTAATGWYAPELPSTISSEGDLGLPGALIKLDHAKGTIEATTIATGASVVGTDIQLPKGTIKLSAEALKKILTQ